MLSKRDASQKANVSPRELLAQIGLRVVERRQALDLSQKDLAEKLDIAAPTVSRIEHGQQNITIRTLCKVAEALEMTPAELFTGTK
jgi:transcriptional regulator with XRE-family HTH domain